MQKAESSLKSFETASLGTANKVNLKNVLHFRPICLNFSEDDFLKLAMPVYERYTIVTLKLLCYLSHLKQVPCL